MMGSGHTGKPHGGGALATCPACRAYADAITRRLALALALARKAAR